MFERGIRVGINHYLAVDSNGLMLNKVKSRNSRNTSQKGYILEVDVRYPRELHDSHKDIPFMCERMKINGVEKLIPNLYDKNSGELMKGVKIERTLKCQITIFHNVNEVPHFLWYHSRDQREMFDMKFDDIGLQGVAVQSQILFLSILSLCKLYEIVFY